MELFDFSEHVLGKSSYFMVFKIFSPQQKALTKQCGEQKR